MNICSDTRLNEKDSPETFPNSKRLEQHYGFHPENGARAKHHPGQENAGPGHYGKPAAKNRPREAQENVKKWKNASGQLTSALATSLSVTADEAHGVPHPQPGTSEGPAERGGLNRNRGGGMNANHLLNFQPYMSTGKVLTTANIRPASGRRGGGSSSAAGSGNNRSGRNAHNGSGGRILKYDRNKFLQANFRFLVSDAIDDAQFHADPDLMFDWDDVIQVEVAVNSGKLQCPISLDSPPVCPQITPCGHVFSFPSIMQHLMTHGGEKLRCSAPCPLCFAPLVARELRLVSVREVKPTVKVGDSVSFQLLQRSRGSIVPEARCTILAATASTAEETGESNSLKHISRVLPSTSRAAEALPGDVFGLGANIFSKFSVIHDATLLWEEAAHELAGYAALVTSEGGLEAAIMAPYIYASLEALALRARKWTFRQAEGLALKSQKLGPAGLVAGTPCDNSMAEELAAEAESIVKRAFTATSAGSTQAESSSEPGPSHKPSEGIPHEDFPSLPAPAPKPQPFKKVQPAAEDAETKPSGEERSTLAADVAGAALTHEVKRSPNALGDEFSFAAAFSDDEQDLHLGIVPQGGVEVITALSSAPDQSEAESPSRAADDEDLSACFEGGSSPPSEYLMGTSPNTTLMNATNTKDEFFMYQACDGTWVFLHPLNLRCLLHHYKSYEACPSLLQATIVELEDVVQTEVTRKRWRFLAHLPITASFKLAEVSLEHLIPHSSLTPFTEELMQRDKRRKRRAAEERKQAAREAAEARAAAEAKRGPSIQELRAMPLPSASLQAAVATAAAAAAPSTSPTSDDPELMLAIEASLSSQAPGTSPSSTPGSSTAAGGIGWAHLVKMGYAATGPTLGTSPPPASFTGAVVQPTGAWASKRSPAAAAVAPSHKEPASAALNAGASSSSTAGQAGPSATAQVAGSPWTQSLLSSVSANKATMVEGADSGAGGVSNRITSSGKSKKGVLLFTTAQRKY